MSGAIAEVHWFPTHADRFLTWGSEINLYQLKSCDDVDQHVATNINLNISASTTAILLAAETRYQYIRCVAPSYRRNGELVLAVGLANGKVGLCNFVSNTENNVEFTPKQSRPCVCLAWHQQDTNLLAIGHDRNRSDHCITVWDTERGLPKEKAITNLIGLSETAHSLCWDNQSRILISGMSHKYMKVFDFRHSTPLVSTNNTRAVHGLAMSPNGRLVTSFIDNLVTLWDLRNIEKPVAIYPMEKNVSALSWCTTRQSTLAIVQRDVAHIQLLDLHGSGKETELSEPFSIKRVVSPFQPPNHHHQQQQRNSNSAVSPQQHAAAAAAVATAPTPVTVAYQQPPVRGVTLAGISWHPHCVERMLVLSGSGQIVDFTVQQRVAIAFDTQNNLCGSLGMNMRCLRQSQTQLRALAAAAASPNSSSLSQGMQQLQMCGAGGATGLSAGTASSVEAIEVAGEWHVEHGAPDVMDLFYRRALNDYGKLQDLQRNGNLAENEALVPVWQLIAHTSNNGNGSRDDSFAGLCEILGISTGRDAAPMYGSETELLYWPEYPTAPSVKMFRNEARVISQQLCGWTFDASKPDTIQTFCNQLCARDEYTRAAMIACMQQQVGIAIEVLQLGADHMPESNLHMAAMGLSGLSFDKDTKWRAQCKTVRNQLKDPFLRALFAFLTPDTDPHFDSILQETTIAVSDRVAFACQFLCDAKLAEYVKRLIAECHEAGNLCGLLLTGARPAGVDLLQSFVDRHEDVQTAALVSVKFLPSDLLAGDQVQFWVDSYRELLDVWGLWEHRAHFDITIGQLRDPPRFARSVFLLCSFCGKSVSACLAEESRLRSASANVNKMSSCPNCRKPLPRCSLCLLHMGTTTGWPVTSSAAGTTATTTSSSSAAASSSSASSSPSSMAVATSTVAVAGGGGVSSTAGGTTMAGGGELNASASLGAMVTMGGGWQSRPFSRWFSWCQTCRHGGHTEHLTEWFELHSECPVASCSCKCFALDVAVPAYSSVTSIF